MTERAKQAAATGAKPRVAVEWSSTEEDCKYFDRLMNSALCASQLAKIGAGSVQSALIYSRPGVRFLNVTKDGERAGFFLALERSDSNWECHTCLEKSLTLAEKIEAGKLGVKAFFDAVHVGTLLSFCPFGSPEALLYALKVGFRVSASDSNGYHVFVCR